MTITLEKGKMNVSDSESIYDGFINENHVIDLIEDAETINRILSESHKSRLILKVEADEYKSDREVSFPSQGKTLKRTVKII